MTTNPNVSTKDLHMGPGWYMRRTSNATALAPFYVDGLGTSNIRGQEPVYFLWAGETFIIELKAEKPPRDERVTDPAVHPCTPVFHSRDLNRTLTRLLRAGGEIVGSEDTPFGRDAFVLDPDKQIVGVREPLSGEHALGRDAVSDFNPGCTPLPDDLIGLRSIVRRVADVKAMGAFYADVIGFNDMGMVNGRRLFDMGEGVHLEVAPGGAEQVPPKDRVEITNHFIIRVTDHDAFNAALKNNGVGFSNDSFRWNSADMSICIDPEGHIMGFEERFEPHEYGHPRDPFEEDLEADRRWRRRLGLLNTRDADGLEAGYAASRLGAIPYRRRPGSDPTKRPLVILNAAHDASATALINAFNGDRDLLVLGPTVDPGPGQAENPPSVPEQAMAIGDALDGLGYRVTQAGQVDVMGCDAGAVIAAELAVLRPDVIAKAVLVAFPEVPSEDRLPHMRQPVLVIDTASDEAGHTKAAREFLNNADYEKVNHPTEVMFETHAMDLAQTIETFVDKPLAPYVPLRA